MARPPTARSTESVTTLATPADMTDIGRIVATAAGEFGGNQAALAAELGVTRATVSRWLSGQSIPDEGSCLRLAKLTGHAAVEVFRLAGRDINLLPPEPDVRGDLALAARLRQWERLLSRLSAADRAVALGIVDDMIRSLCHRFSDSELVPSVADTPGRERRRTRDARPVGGLAR